MNAIEYFKEVAAAAGVKLRPEFKRRWLGALRSGDYAQTMGTMRTGYGFCCLGVACDILNPSLWVRERDTYSWLGLEAMPTASVSAAEMFEGEIDGNDFHAIMSALSAANDDSLSFAQIALAIEEAL